MVDFHPPSMGLKLFTYLEPVCYTPSMGPVLVDSQVQQEESERHRYNGDTYLLLRFAGDTTEYIVTGRRKVVWIDWLFWQD